MKEKKSPNIWLIFLGTVLLYAFLGLVIYVLWHFRYDPFLIGIEVIFGVIFLYLGITGFLALL